VAAPVVRLAAAPFASSPVLGGATRSPFAVSGRGDVLVTLAPGRLVVWSLSSLQFLRTVPVGPDGISALAFDHTGRFLALARYGWQHPEKKRMWFRQEVEIWDTRTWRVVQRLRGLSSDDYELRFSPDGRYLAWRTGGESGVFDLTTGQRIIEAWGPEAFAFRSVASGFELVQVHHGDPTFRYFEISRDGQVRKAPASVIAARRAGELLCGADVSADGRIAATSDYAREKQPENPIEIWSIATGKRLFALPARGKVDSLKLSSDGSRLVIRYWNPAGMEIWDLHTGRRLSFDPLAAPGDSVGFDPKQRRILVAGPETFRVFDARTGQRLVAPTPQVARQHAVDFTPDGRLLAVAGADADVALWDLGRGAPVRHLGGHATGARALAFGPEGRQLAAVDARGSVRLWTVATGQLVWTRTLRDEELSAVAFEPGGDGLVVGSDQGATWLDLRTGAPSPAHAWLKDHGGVETRGLIFSRDGRLLALTLFMHFTVLDRATRRRLALSARRRTMQVLALSPDSQWIAIGHQGYLGGLVDVYHLRKGLGPPTCVPDEDPEEPEDKRGCAPATPWRFALEAPREGDTDCHALAFHPDSRHLAVGEGRHFAVWNLEKRKVAWRSAAHGAAVTSLAFHPGGRYLATAGGDRVVKLWDSKSGRLLASLVCTVEKEWLVFTPGGTVEGSAGAHRLLMWQTEAMGVVPGARLWAQQSRARLLPGLLAKLR
jgi:WD40 repeat protein